MKTLNELNKHLKRCKNCGTKFLAVKQVNSIKKIDFNNKITVKAVPVLCNSYFCTTCAKKKQKIIYSKTINNLKNQSWRFITLTTINNRQDFATSSKLANDSWNKLATLIRRRFANFKYIKVAEVGKNGMFHFHILCNIYIPQTLLKYYWEKYTQAYIVDVRKVQDNRKAVNYIIKYIYKTFENEETNKKFFLNQKRRFSFSRNFATKFVKSYTYIKISNIFFSYSSINIFFSYLSRTYQDLIYELPPPNSA